MKKTVSFGKPKKLFFLRFFSKKSLDAENIVLTTVAEIFLPKTELLSFANGKRWKKPYFELSLLTLFWASGKHFIDPQKNPCKKSPKSSTQIPSSRTEIRLSRKNLFLNPCLWTCQKQFLQPYYENLGKNPKRLLSKSENCRKIFFIQKKFFLKNLLRIHKMQFLTTLAKKIFSES